MNTFHARIALNIVVMLLSNSTISFGMISLYESNNPTGSELIHWQHLQRRINNTSPLLLKDGPFNFSGLPADLQTRIASFALPHRINNLQKTCTFLRDNLTFQTPQVWNIVRHSLNCVSTENMPKLLLKAHLREKSNSETIQSIKKKILSNYPFTEDEYPYTYCALNPRLCLCLFFPFGSEHAESIIAAKLNKDSFSDVPIKEQDATDLMLASYTGDIQIVKDILQNKDPLTSSHREMEHSLFIAIQFQDTHIIPLLCKWKTWSRQCKRKDYKIKWDARLFCNTAFNFGLVRAFEALVMFYKDYLNETGPVGNQTYLDSLIKSNGIDQLCADGSEDYRTKFYNIVTKYGGIKTPKKPSARQCAIQ